MRDSRRLFGLLCMAGFFSGILYANIFLKADIASIGIFNEFFLNQYTQTDINENKYLMYLIRLRLLPVAGIFGVGFLKVRKILVILLITWTGFLCGIIVTAAIMKIGVKGILFCGLAFFPQLPFYVFGYGLLLWNTYNYPRIKWNFLKILLIFVVTCIGIVSECYINPLIIKMFLKTV